MSLLIPTTPPEANDPPPEHRSVINRGGRPPKAHLWKSSARTRPGSSSWAAAPSVSSKPPSDAATGSTNYAPPSAAANGGCMKRFCGMWDRLRKSGCVRSAWWLRAGYRVEGCHRKLPRKNSASPRNTISGVSSWPFISFALPSSRDRFAEFQPALRIMSDNKHVSAFRHGNHQHASKVLLLVTGAKILSASLLTTDMP